jgi:hypothetical protein
MEAIRKIRRCQGISLRYRHPSKAGKETWGTALPRQCRAEALDGEEFCAAHLREAEKQRCLKSILVYGWERRVEEYYLREKAQDKEKEVISETPARVASTRR